MKTIYKICSISTVLLFIGSGIWAQSPTYPALGYNIFTENDLTPKTNESEGPIACGGNLYIDGNYQVSAHNAGSFTVQGVPISLLVNGKVKYISGNALQVNQNGYVKIGNSYGSNVWYFDQNNAASPMRVTPNSNYNATPRIHMQANSVQLGVSSSNNPVFQGNLVDFASAFSTMRATSTSMAQCDHSVTVKNANGQVIPNTNLPKQIKLNLANGKNVFNITGGDLNYLDVMTFENQPNSSKYIVINVNAPGTFNWDVCNQAGIGFQNAPYIIWNFYNTTQLFINGATIEGTVFAPFANVDKPGQSNIEGQMIAKSFIQRGGEMHYAIFAPAEAGCNNAMPTPPTASFSVNPSTQCLDGNDFKFVNTSTMLSCPSFTSQSFSTSGEATSAFNELYFSAEGRGGNNATSGTHELNIHNFSPYSILDEDQFIWPNGQYVPFTIVYDPNAVGDNKFIYTIGTTGVGAGQKVLKLDPVAAGYPETINAIWFYSRTAPNTTLLVSNVEIDGNPVNNNLGYINPSVAMFENVAFSGTDLEDGFTITGQVKFAWTGSIPTNSNLNFNFKLGNMDCVPAPINQPNNQMTYLWDFGDGTTSTMMNPDKTYANPGTYTVTLTVTNNDGSDTETFDVTVLAPTAPVVSENIISSGNGELVKEFTLNNPGDFTYFSWGDDNTNMGLYVNQSTVTFSYTQAGTYHVYLNTTDANGCKNQTVFAVTVTSDQVNGGNGGGIESESLGDALSKVYVNRKLNDVPTEFVLTDDLIFEKPMALRNNAQQLVDFFPSSVMAGDVAHVTSPTDILNYTIAEEVLSIDYSLGNKTKAVILGIVTTDKVYNHTKASCDRLRGAEILNVEQVEIGEHSFLMQTLRQRNNVVEYAISFALSKNNNDEQYGLQTNWLVGQYTPANMVYNIQVWSVDPVQTKAIVAQVLENSNMPITALQNTVVPETYVSKVAREDFDLVLTLHSEKESQSIEVIMDEIYSETHGFALRYTPITSDFVQELRMPIFDGYEYEGQVFVNGIKQDDFYHADGNWGLDYDPSNTLINHYQITNNFERELDPEAFLIHRNIQLSCVSDDYITIYKSLLPAQLPADYSDYKYVSFTIKGGGLVELGLIKSSITAWENQYRANIMTRSFEQTFYVPFDFFTSTGTTNTLNPNDLTLLTFNLIPSEIGSEELNFEISDVKFTKSAPEGYEELLVSLQNEFITYPNPSEGNVTCVVYSNAKETAQVTLRDVTGKVVYTTQITLEEGRNDVPMSFGDFANGLMFLSIESEDVNFGTTKVIFR